MRALLCAAALSLLFACGSNAVSTPQSCSGCTDSGGCEPGTSASACGSGGGVCRACAASEQCSAGQCVTATRSLIGAKCATTGDCGGGSALCESDAPGGGYCTQECATAACPGGSSCIATGSARLCLQACSSSADCRPEHLCFSAGAGSVCLPKCTRDADCASANCNVSTGVCGPSRVGIPCTANGDCGDAPAFCDTTTSAGYCSLPCGGDASPACPPSSACISVGTGAACLALCTSTCRAGESCTNVSGVQVCIPNCRTDADCGATSKCDSATGACRPGGPAAGQLGGACTSAQDCPLGSGAYCGNYPGGYCTIDCTSSAAACGTGGTCVSFGSSAACLNDCTSARDCRSGYVCYPLGGNAGSVCAPACTSDASCGSGQACDRTTGQCVAPATGSMAITTVDLTPSGPIAVATNTLSAKLTTTVPAGAISVTFVGQASDATARVVVYRIESPDGRIYDDGATSSPMKVLPPSQPGAFAVLAPNSPSAPFTPGTWTIYLLASKATTATVHALIKTSTQSPLATGSIDMNLFFVGVPGISAASAPTDAHFQAVLDQVKATWSQIGISVGRLTYNDLATADVTTFQDLDESQLGALMTRSLTPGANDNALNVFLVHSITGGGLAGYIILGESAGIPGVPVRGTTGSGLAVTTADFPNGLADIADTWVHEGSHWLGLFHTTESGGAAFDPIPDTAQCPLSPNDANGNGLVEPAECLNLGADNEMFWTSVSTIPHSHLTPNQQFVLLRNPAVH